MTTPIWDMDNRKAEKALESMDHQMLETSQRPQASINQMVLHCSISGHLIRIWADTQLADLMIEAVQAYEEAISRDLTAALIMLALIRVTSCLLAQMDRHSSRKDKLAWVTLKGQWLLSVTNNYLSKCRIKLITEGTTQMLTMVPEDMMTS